MTVCSLIVTYNRPIELVNCIQSILRQTIKPKLIIIIDNGSIPSAIGALQCSEILKQLAVHSYDDEILEVADYFTPTPNMSPNGSPTF